MIGRPTSPGTVLHSNDSFISYTMETDTLIATILKTIGFDVYICDKEHRDKVPCLSVSGHNVEN